MKKKITALALVVVLVALLISGMTIAYFTDTDEATNTFTVGSIDIDLWETDKGGNEVHDGGLTFENVVPGVEYPKDPTVTNTGTNPAYVRLTVCFQPGVNSAFMSGYELTDFLVGLSDKWTFIGDGAILGNGHFGVEHQNCWYAVFNYNGALAAGESTDALFTAFQIPADMTQEYFDTFVGDGFTIDVTAEAIQAEGFDNATNALATFGNPSNLVASWDELADTDWYTGDKTEYTINTAEDLIGLAELISDKKLANNLTITLGADIDLSGRVWTPINAWSDPVLTITLDGAGHTISNMSVAGKSSIGFIGSNTADWTIKNLTFDGAEINASSGGSYVGIVIGYQYGDVVMENVKVTNATVSAEGIGNCIGGLVGFSVQNDGATLTLTNCTVSDSELTGYHGVSGLVGSIKVSGYTETLKINGCAVEDTVITYTATGGVGGHVYASGGSGYLGAAFAGANNTNTNVYIIGK